MSEFERLTWRSKSGNLYAKGWNPYTRTYEKRVENITVTSKDALKRLAEYEDSRLSPERAGDLALAETDGRLIELPVKFGDTVWCTTSDLGTITQPAECTVVFIGVDSHGLYFNMYSKSKSKDMMDYPACMNERTFEDFGKTVFMTREAAEAAMQEVIAEK